MADAARFLLSDADSDAIFASHILPNETDNADLHSQFLPRAAITGGQPGAGKSRLMEEVVQRDSFLATGSDPLATGPGERRALVISGDDLRRYHPEYARLQREDPINAAFNTDRDSGRWVEKLTTAAMGRRYNLIIESTMRQSATFERTSNELRNLAYAVDADVLAVRPSLSWVGVKARYERAVAMFGAGRNTLRCSHDAAVFGLPVTLGAIYDRRLADEFTIADTIVIWDRSFNKLYENKSTGNRRGWERPERPDDFIVAFHNRPATAIEIETLEAL